MQTRSPAAVELLNGLDAELASAGEATGDVLVWSAAEVEARRLLGDTVDRRADLALRYSRQRETKVRVKLSAEIRMLDRAIMLLLKEIRTDVPQAESLTTIKARRAANVRWDKARATS